MIKACVIAPIDFSPPHCRINDEIDILKKNNYDVKLLLASSSLKLESYEKNDNLEIFRIFYSGILRWKLPILNSIFMTFCLFLKAREIDAKIYHCHDYQTSHVAYLLSLSGKKVIYDIGDDSPSNHRTYFRLRVSKSLFLGKFIENSIRYLEGAIMKKCDITFSLSQTMKEDRINFTEKIKVLKYSPNYNTKTINEKNLKTSNRVIYQGALSEDKGLFSIFKAIYVVSKFNKKIELVIAGYMPDNSWHKIKSIYSKEWLEKHITFLGFLDYRKIEKEISKSFLGLCILQPFSYSYSATIPNKLIDYMASGIPHITTSNLYESRLIVQKSNSGKLVDFFKFDDLVKAILNYFEDRTLAVEHAKNGLAYVEKEHNFRYFSKKYLKTYSNLNER